MRRTSRQFGRRSQHAVEPLIKSVWSRAHEVQSSVATLSLSLHIDGDAIASLGQLNPYERTFVHI